MDVRKYEMHFECLPGYLTSERSKRDNETLEFKVFNERENNIRYQ